MSIFFEAIISIFIAIFIVGAIWLIYGRLAKPVKAGKGETLYALIYVRDSAFCLEQTVNGMLWFVNSGRIDMYVIIADGGMDEESRKMAELIVQRYSAVKLCRADELHKVLAGETEEEWPKRSLTK